MLFSKNTTINNRVIGLDLIRFFAIVFVVWGHACFLIPIEVREQYSYFNIIDGVSVFFVLSGYLIGSILIRLLSQTEFTYKDLLYFWIRRWFRTLPNYFLILVLLIFISVDLKGFDNNYFFFTQNLFASVPFFFPESWSLCVEEWFYFIFPLTLFLFVLFTKRKNRSFLILTTIFIIFPLLLRLIECFDAGISGSIKVFMNHIVIFRLDSLMYGVFGAYISFYFKAFWNKYSVLFFILGLIILFLYLIKKIFAYKFSMLFELAFNLNVESIAILFILPFLSSLKSLRFNALNKLVSYISKISYSMYLVHYSLVFYIILPVVIKLLYLNHFRFEVSCLFTYLLYWILTISISTVIYYFYEKPIMNIRDKIRFSESKKQFLNN
jgi:peptidoglycan/LPS O-acetylase OafA/YrhL